MVKILNYFFIFLMAICVCKCRSIHPWENLDNSTTFKREVPLNSKGKESFLESINFIRDSLKLDTIDKKGFEDLQIRIWFTYSFTSRQQLIVIKNINDKWTGIYYQFGPNYYKLSDSLINFDKTITLLKPKNSWDFLINQLIDNNILTLPEGKSVGKYSIAHDCDQVSIEIATKKVYRLYGYSCVWLNDKKFREFKNVKKIIDLLTEEFDIKLLGII